NLKNNRLEHLDPNALSSLASSCQVLELDNNCLTQLPDTLSSMTQLRFLSLQHNQLTQIPSGLLTALLQLQDLHVQGNPIADPVFGAKSRRGRADVPLNPQGAALLAAIQDAYL
ncbi:Probable serine/threonine-protein kinase roco9 (Ras of complex proteins and C-terminal of roc 9), partial [Durusdinium trenchii]